MKATIVAFLLMALVSCTLDFQEKKKKKRGYHPMHAPAAARHHSAPALLKPSPPVTTNPSLNSIRKGVNLEIKATNQELESAVEDQRKILAR